MKQYHDLPRRYFDTTHSSGRSEFPRHIAEDILSKAPFPTHSKSCGRRPHAHYDTENLFKHEKPGKETLDGGKYEGPKGDPVLWAYPATYFDYESQNRRGNEPRDRGGKPLGLEPGPHRIVTDKNKQIQGMITHGFDEDRRFLRAPARIAWNDSPESPP